MAVRIASIGTILGCLLVPFIAVLFFLGFFGGNFATFSLWLPEQYATAVRATAFAFATSFGRFIGAGVNFGGRDPGHTLAGLALGQTEPTHALCRAALEALAGPLQQQLGLAGR